MKNIFIGSIPLKKGLGEINKKKNIIKFSINNEDYRKQIYPISRIYFNGIL